MSQSKFHTHVVLGLVLDCIFILTVKIFFTEKLICINKRLSKLSCSKTHKGNIKKNYKLAYKEESMFSSKGDSNSKRV